MPLTPDPLEFFRLEYFEPLEFLEFRKRIRWYARQMHPCRMLKDAIRVMNSPAEFEEAIARFLDWRLKHDEDVRAGRASPIYEGELVEAA